MCAASHVTSRAAVLCAGDIASVVLTDRIPDPLNELFIRVLNELNAINPKLIAPIDLLTLKSGLPVHTRCFTSPLPCTPLICDVMVAGACDESVPVP
jgi:hypothetical protein